MDCWTRIPDLGNLNRYYEAINAFPLLTYEEELEAGTKKDEHSILKLVLSHLRLASALARKYYTLSTGGVGDSDLIQEANVALMVAAQRFDPTKGRFSSYATRYILDTIHLFIMRNHRIVRIVTTKGQQKMYYNLGGEKRRLLDNTGRVTLNDAEVQRVAEKFQVRPDEVREMEQRLSVHDVAFDAGLNDEGEDDFGVKDFLKDTTLDPLVQLQRAERDWLESEGVEEALAILSDREQFIIRSRFMQDDTLTLHELATIFGISGERVRQIEANALKKMKEHLKEYA